MVSLKKLTSSHFKLLDWTLQDALNGRVTRVVRNPLVAQKYAFANLYYLDIQGVWLDDSGNFVVNYLMYGTGDRSKYLFGPHYCNFPLLYTEVKSELLSVVQASYKIWKWIGSGNSHPATNIFQNDLY